MPSLPPFFNGNISGILTVYVSDISWYKSGPKITHVLLEWNGSHDKDKLLTSKFSKITYDIRTSYKSLLYYLSTCMLKCSVKCCENKTFAYASTKNLILTEGTQLVKTLPLIKNEEIVGILQLCFNLQTFNDTSFADDIKYLTQFGIQNEAFNILNGNYIYHTEMFKPKRDARSNTRPISNSSSNLSTKTSRSKEELACNYLMGKDMGFDEEKEALSTLKIMPSAEKIVETAEKTDIYSDFLSPLQVQGCSKMFTNIKPGVKNINTIQTNVKKSCPELNKSELQEDFFKNFQKANTSKYNIYLQLTILSINIYHSIKSFKKNKNSTFIVQCLKDQEPIKMLRFMSRHLDDNVVQFKNATQSALLDGCTTKGITIKVYVRILSRRTPIILGETKQMLDWDRFSATLDVCRCIKIPIWNNDKITGHLFLSYEFSKTPSIQNYKENFPEIQVDDIIEINDNPEKEQPESSKISIPFDDTENKKKAAIGNKAIPLNHKKDDLFKNDKMYPKKNIFTNKLSCDEQFKNNLDNAVKEDTKINSIATYQKENQKYVYDRMYPEKDFDTVSQLSLNGWTKKELVKVTKGVQTNFEVRQFHKSVQTHVRNSNVAIQVDSDELLEDPLDSTICCGVQNIFRCTHEFTFNIKKKCNSTFNYVTYKFPECVTNNIGKVITCCRLFRTYGNTNILHLITLPTTIPLDTYLCNYYKKEAIVLNLHQSDNYSLGKVSLLASHLVDMANEFTSSHVTKNFVLSDNFFVHEPSNKKVCIELHYKKVYHSFPATKKSIKNSSDSCSKRNLPKNNSKLIVDLTESDSEDSSINKTYTLFENNNKLMEMKAQTNSTPVKVFHGFKKRTESNSTQTELIPIKMIRDLKISTDNSTQTKHLPVKISCSLKTHTNNKSTQTEQMPAKILCDLKTRTECSSQTDPMPIQIFNNCTTQTELAMQRQCITSIDVSDTDEKNIGNASFINVPENQTDIDQENCNFDKPNSSDIFKARVIIVCGYDFPMVTLAGDTVPTAPTTYIIMKDHGEHTLSTSSVVETTNPVWNCEWTVELPKTKLIKGEWLLLQLWYKNFKNEYAGHDNERDTRLGFIIINVCALDDNKAGKLYDVISETEEHHGKVKVLINLIDFVDSQANVCFVRKQTNDKTVTNVSDKIRNSNDHSISEMLGEIKIKNSSQATFKKPSISVAVKDDRCRCYVDLTVDSLQKTMIDPNDCNDTQTNENCATQQANTKKDVCNKKENKKSNEEYVVRNDNNWDSVDLTVDSLQKVNQIPFQNTADSCLKDCFSNNGKTVDSGSISSVVSWTSSSNEILCSNNSWVTNIP